MNKISNILYLQNKVGEIFRKNFFNTCLDSVSTRSFNKSFLVHQIQTNFLTELKENHLLEIYLNKNDYNLDHKLLYINIHKHIYLEIESAKFILITTPPNILSLSLRDKCIMPIDYYGAKYFKVLKVFNPKKLINWDKRAVDNIITFFKDNMNLNIMVIKGFAVINYGRDIDDISSKLNLLENSCRIINDNFRK